MNLFECDMILFGSNLTLIVSSFKFQELLVMLEVALINFGVKNQVPQVSFKVVAGDLISFLTLGYDMNLFGYNLFGSDLILFGSNFRFQEPLVMLVAALTNIGVKNQVTQVFFKFVVGDLVLVSSYEVSDILFCE